MEVLLEVISLMLREREIFHRLTLPRDEREFIKTLNLINWDERFMALIIDSNSSQNVKNIFLTRVCSSWLCFELFSKIRDKNKIKMLEKLYEKINLQNIIQGFFGIFYKNYMKHKFYINFFNLLKFSHVKTS